MYERLLSDGFVKEEDQEPEVGYFIYYLEAFWELSTCRSAGMSEGPIPFTAIKNYFEVFPDEDFYDFLRIIRTMDDTFLVAKRAKSERENKSGGKKK